MNIYIYIYNLDITTYRSKEIYINYPLIFSDYNGSIYRRTEEHRGCANLQQLHAIYIYIYIYIFFSWTKYSRWIYSTIFSILCIVFAILFVVLLFGPNQEDWGVRFQDVMQIYNKKTNENLKAKIGEIDPCEFRIKTSRGIRG